MRRFFTFKNKRHMPKWIAWILACFLQLFAWTFRVRIHDPYGFFAGFDKEPFQPTVSVIWHNRLLFFAPLARRRVLEKCAVLISASRDGEYISTFIRFFGLNVVRGSSSRGALQALHALFDAVEHGRTAVLTVDGPRGPRYTVHNGAAAIAKHCGVAIVPASLNAKHKWQLKSWDRMQIPMPFTRVDFVLGRPVVLSPDEPLEEANERVKRALMDITED